VFKINYSSRRRFLLYDLPDVWAQPVMDCRQNIAWCFWTTFGTQALSWLARGGMRTNSIFMADVAVSGRR